MGITQAVNLEMIAARTGDLPPLPASAMRAMQMTKDPEVTASELQTVISQDQALSAKILRIVNSAMYSLRREVSTVSHAVTILGMENLRSIIMAASIQQFNETGMRRAGGLATRLLADHSWCAAVAARAVARHIRYPNLEEAFLCGLIHDLGKPALLFCIPDRYSEIFNDAYRGAATFHDAEISGLGFTHAQVGSMLAQKWNFPQHLCEAIGYHHDPLSAPKFAKLACVTSLANQMMVFLEIGFEKNPNLKLDGLPEVAHLKLNRPALDSILNEVKASQKQQA
ncbi:MAG TPA: HDOD domain-containing protein [Acidobacteriota bacterium]|nr:HDOD domain-containing protein [Acidobacteriota bacterium]